jgi:hypothetical protein
MEAGAAPGPYRGRAPAGADPAQTVKRWMYIWITIGILVVLVVVGFLFGIAGSLESIDRNLGEARDAVAGARSDVDPLPAYIQGINARLIRVDGALKPIPAQADRINSNLSSIAGHLHTAEGALGHTSASLRDTSVLLTDTSGRLINISTLLRATSGSLVDISGDLISTAGFLTHTSGVLSSASNRLVSTRTLVRRIDRRLIVSQVRSSLGTNAIWRRVRFINGGRRDRHSAPNPNGLTAVKGDTSDITAGLRQVNVHLDSICRAPLGVGTGTVPPQPPC